LSEDVIQLPPDSTGKKTATVKGALTNPDAHSQVVILVGWTGKEYRRVLVDDSGKLQIVTQ
jgi:hypothetical protein